MSVGMVTPVVAGGHMKDILIIQSPEFHFNDRGGFVPAEGGNKAARQSFSWRRGIRLHSYAPKQTTSSS